MGGFEVLEGAGVVGEDVGGCKEGVFIFLEVEGEVG